MQDFSMSFDPGSLTAIERLAGFGALLDPEIIAALAWSGELVVTTAQANTWRVFANPTGQLADSISFRMASPMEAEVGVGVPYGRRREYGFSGMTDALGRFYPYDPGKPYLGPALEEDIPLIRAKMELACYNALGRLVGL